MAFYLEFGENSYVDLGSFINPTASDSFKVVFEVQGLVDGQDYYLISRQSSSSDYFRFFSDGRFFVRGNDTSRLTLNTSTPKADITKIEVSVTGTTCELYINDVFEDSGTLSQATEWFINRIGSDNGGNTQDLYRAQFFINDILVNEYDPSASNGTGQILPDTVGGNDGTLVNFPTDNSQWVFFDDGGGGAVTVDGATALPSLTATGNASATLPQPSLSASINLTQLSATGSASATLPQPDASGSIVFSTPTATGSVTATLPQPTLQAAITLPVVTANGNASATLPGFNLSASVNIPTLTATGAAQATLPQPVVSASITMPSLTALGAAEATEPNFTVSGNVTLQPPTVTGSVSATLPQPSISGNIALPSIQASGFIIGGEIVITVELETNINEPQLSANINEPQLSTNINGPKLSTNITE